MKEEQGIRESGGRILEKRIVEFEFRIAESYTSISEYQRVRGQSIRVREYQGTCR